MSTDANAALAWPIEVTASAAIGDQLVGRKKTPASVVTVWAHLHAAEVEDGVPVDENNPVTELELCGTTIPGDVSLPCLRDDTETGFHRDHPEARMRWSNSALAWVCAPFVGDSLSDPRVQVEGTETGAWMLDPHTGPFRVSEFVVSPFERNMDLMHSLGSGPAFDNHEAPMGGDGVYVASDEPEDYDSYVDYVCGRKNEQGNRPPDRNGPDWSQDHRPARGGPDATPGRGSEAGAWRG